MTRVVAIVLLAFVVFACGDPVNVEKRTVSLGNYGTGLLGKDGLPGASELGFKNVLAALRKVITTLRKTIKKLNVCPNKASEYQDGQFGHNKPSYEPGYEPEYEPQYKRSADFDMGCDVLKPVLDGLDKALKAVEKMLGCMMDKEEGYGGDYKDCEDDYKKDAPQGFYY